MRAMILAAGLGTRLLPLTRSRPKALTPLRNVTMVEFWIERLARCGFDGVFVNAFHQKERLGAEILAGRWPVCVEVLNEPFLLGTGGGILAAAEHAGEAPFAVVNVDVLSNADLGALYRMHRLSGAGVSLLFHDCPRFNNVAVSQDRFVLGFGGEAKEIVKKTEGARLLAFTGIHFVTPSVLCGLASGAAYDIIGIYRDLIAKGEPPGALFQKGLFWREMGSVESYANLTGEIAGLAPALFDPIPTGELVTIDPQARIDPGCRLEGSIAIGRGTIVREEVSLENVILWENVVIEKGSRLKDCIVADGMRVCGVHSGKIFAPEPA